MNTQYRKGNKRDYKDEYEFAGHSIFDARPVFARFTTEFSIEFEVIKPKSFNGIFYEDGTRYPDNYIRK